MREFHRMAKRILVCLLMAVLLVNTNSFSALAETVSTEQGMQQSIATNPEDAENETEQSNSRAEGSAEPEEEETETEDTATETAEAEAVLTKEALMSVETESVSAYANGSANISYNETKNAFTSSSYYQSDRALGIAGNFHIVAFDTATLNSHTNGNILAQNLKANSNFGTNTHEDAEFTELSYVQNYLQVNGGSAARTEDTLVVGSSNTLGSADNGNAVSINGTKLDKPKNVIQDTDTDATPYIDLEEVEDTMESLSDQLGTIADTCVTVHFADQNNREIAISNPNGVSCYNMSAAELNSISSNPLKLTGFQSNCNGSLIIHVDCSGVETVTMPQSAIVYVDGVAQGTSETNVFSNGKVIWNFTNAAGVTINTGITLGSVLAPGATVNVNQNLNGTIIAENVNINAESHRTDFTGTLTPLSTKISGTKTLEGGEVGEYRFKFDLYDGLGEDANRIATAENDENGQFTFPEISYTSTGTYTYYMKENVNSVEGITYDRSVYQVTVTVVSGLNGGVLTYTAYVDEIKKIADSDGKEITPAETEEITFANSRDLGSLEIKKTVTGLKEEDNAADKEYEFTVKRGDSYYREDGTPSDTEVILQVKAGEKVTINSLPVGEYTVTEKDAEMDGYTLAVTGTGSVSIAKDETKELTVINEYELKTGEFLLQKLDGNAGSSLSGDFAFTLKDASDQVVEGYNNVTVDENGQIMFENLPYGDYSLEESQTPDTYATLEEPIQLTISEEGVSWNNQNLNAVELTKDPGGVTIVNVKNYKWIAAPETGSDELPRVLAAGFGLLLAGMLLMIIAHRRERKGSGA